MNGNCSFSTGICKMSSVVIITVGNSDTIAAIAGSLAETIYEIPDDLAERAMNCLARELREVVDRIQKFL